MATYQAICETCGEIDDPTDEDTATDDMNEHVRQHRGHTVNIEVTQDED